jgi:hypothetical protein
MSARVAEAKRRLTAVRDLQAREWATLIARLDAAAVIDASGRDRDALIAHLDRAADLEYSLTGSCGVIGPILDALRGDS